MTQFSKINNTQPLFSIGYATKPIDVFISQLHEYKIDVVADIRSVPFSKVFHDYHQDAFKNRLKRHGIRYVYLGNELGPRSKDPSHYDEHGQVQFQRLIASSPFNTGLERLFSGMDKQFNIALCCAEKDPATCHRSLLVGLPLLADHTIDIKHIGHDGRIELQSELEQRLLSLTGTEVDMLTSETDALKLAYSLQCKAYAYIRPQSTG